MMSFLFPRLTSSGASRGRALFKALVGEARRPDWYADGQVPDTLDGRFAVLATMIALATVRLERGGGAARLEAVALAEQFVEAMDCEHRELGLGDPALGRTVRKLVAALARRVELWREAAERGDGWNEAAKSSLFGDSPPAPAALAYCDQALRDIWARLDESLDDSLAQGRIG